MGRDTVLSITHSTQLLQAGITSYLIFECRSVVYIECKVHIFMFSAIHVPSQITWRLPLYILTSIAHNQIIEWFIGTFCDAMLCDVPYHAYYRGL